MDFFCFDIHISHNGLSASILGILSDLIISSHLRDVISYLLFRWPVYLQLLDALLKLNSEGLLIFKLGLQLGHLKVLPLERIK